MTLPPPPPGLPPTQRPIWEDTTTRLQNLGITQIDPRHLRAYVRTAANLDQATTLLDGAGAFIDAGGHITTNPATQPHTRWTRDLARLATTLGLTRPAAALPPADPPAPTRPEHWGARWCDQHERWECTKQRSRGRGTCHGPSTDGTDMCRMHGGTSVVAHLAAVAERGAAKAGGVLPGGRDLPDVHPADALLHQVRYWAGLCGWLDDVVAGLERGSMVWGVTREQVDQGGEFPGTVTVRAAGLNTWVQWHERAHRMLAQVCEIALRAEVDQAALALQQAQGMQAFRAFQEGLQKLDLTPGQWEAARVVMPRVLRQLVAA